MIGKIINGLSFQATIDYVLGKEECQVLESRGVMDDSIKSIADSFIIQAQMRPKVSKPVGHIALSFSPKDSRRLTDKNMLLLAQEYMQAMKIEDTQYIVVRHKDAEHPHCHIVYNRINNKGECISSKYNYHQNMRICKLLKDKYGLTYGTGKDRVNVHRLREPSKTKYQIYHTVKEALNKTTNWKDFQTELRKEGVEVKLKYKGQTDEIQGISFTKNDYTFKGSQIDRVFSYSKLAEQLGDINLNTSQELNPNVNTQQNSLTKGFGSIANLLDDENYNEEQEEDQDPKQQKRRGVRR